MSDHPPVDLVRFDIPAPDGEDLLPFINLDEPPLLSLSDDCCHFCWFDVLVFAPLGDTGSVLSQS